MIPCPHLAKTLEEKFENHNPRAYPCREYEDVQIFCYLEWDELFDTHRIFEEKIDYGPQYCDMETDLSLEDITEGNDTEIKVSFNSWLKLATDYKKGINNVKHLLNVETKFTEEYVDSVEILQEMYPKLIFVADILDSFVAVYYDDFEDIIEDLVKEDWEGYVEKIRNLEIMDDYTFIVLLSLETLGKRTELSPRELLVNLFLKFVDFNSEAPLRCVHFYNLLEKENLDKNNPDRISLLEKQRRNKAKSARK